MDEHGHFFHAEFTDMVCYTLLYWNHGNDDEAVCTLCLCQCCILRLSRYRMQCDKCLAPCSHLHLYGQRAQGNVQRLPPLFAKMEKVHVKSSNFGQINARV